MQTMRGSANWPFKFLHRVWRAVTRESPQLNAGDTIQISHDIVSGGKVAFAVAEKVKVEKIEPDPQQPECKYIVYSNRLQ